VPDHSVVFPRFESKNNHLRQLPVLVRQRHATPFAVADPPDSFQLIVVPRAPTAPAPGVLARLSTCEPHGAFDQFLIADLRIK
jgi:hypothetical protein